MLRAAKVTAARFIRSMRWRCRTAQLGGFLRPVTSMVLISPCVLGGEDMHQPSWSYVIGHSMFSVRFWDNGTGVKIHVFGRLHNRFV